jgi:hypothetical protein
MTDFITPTIEVDPAALAGIAFDYLEGAIPNWTPAPSNLDVLVIEAIAQIAAEQAEVAAAVPAAIMRYLGPLVGAPPLEAAPAQVAARFISDDAATSLTVPAGSSIGWRDGDGTLWSFTLIADLLVPAGTGYALGVVVADVPGAGGNGLGGAPTPAGTLIQAELIDVPARVAIVDTQTGTVFTAGGTDAEDDAVYLDRLAETLALMSPRPILPNDFAVLARSIPGVFRASAVDGLKPGPPYDVAAEATGQQRTITVAVADTAGEVVGSTIRAAVDALLQSEREVNFAVYVVDPVYVTIDVTFTVKCWPDATPSVVQAAAIAAVQAWLSPAQWGADQSGDTTTWLDTRTVRLGELYEILNSVDGVRYVQGAPTIGLSGGGQAAADLAIAGTTAIPVLTRAGVIAGTAVA